MVSVICQALFRTPNATTMATWNPILVTPLLFSVIRRGSLQVRPTDQLWQGLPQLNP